MFLLFLRTRSPRDAPYPHLPTGTRKGHCDRHTKHGLTPQRMRLWLRRHVSDRMSYDRLRCRCKHLPLRLNAPNALRYPGMPAVAPVAAPCRRLTRCTLRLRSRSIRSSYQPRNKDHYPRTHFIRIFWRHRVTRVARATRTPKLDKVV